MTTQLKPGINALGEKFNLGKRWDSRHSGVVLTEQLTNDLTNQLNI